MNERELARHVASRFDSRWLQGYVRSKLASDPIYREISPALAGGDRPLLDLGCGIGILGLYLRELGARRPIVGIDFDVKKIEAARRAAAGRENVEYRAGDIRERLAFRGDVVLLDILHYFSDADQRVILENAAHYARDGGTVIIRECLRDSSWRYRLTYVEEFVATSIGWLKGERLNFPTLESIHAILSTNRFGATVRPLWGKTPFNNYLLVYSGASD